MANKQLWRKWAGSQDWRADGQAVKQGVDFFLSAMDSPTVLTYSAMPGEPDVEHVSGVGVRLLTRTPGVGALTVHRADSPMETHRWGYRQPAEGSAVVDPTEIDVVLVPGALFDRHGGRLGHGRGYYDRLLVSCRPDVVRIGITSVRAVVESLPMEAHDIVMTHLATERGVRPVVPG